MNVSHDLRRALLPLKDKIVAKFNKGRWLELGVLTDSSDIVEDHARLLRSLDFGDDDYDGNALSVLMMILARNPTNFSVIQQYVSENLEEGGTSVSSGESDGPRIYFTPSVFTVPDSPPEPDFLTVMMPFAGPFTPVYKGIKEVAAHHGLRCHRADDIWDHSTIIQDVFSLLYRSFIVVCDFTNKNPNVFYEAGIAHTLGKHVIPLTQHPGDIPFDLQAHRYIRYLNNIEGIVAMQEALSGRIATLLQARKPPSVRWRKP